LRELRRGFAQDGRWKKQDTRVKTDGVHHDGSFNPNKLNEETLSEGVKRLKPLILVELIEKHEMDQAIVFVRTQLDCDHLETFLLAYVDPVPALLLPACAACVCSLRVLPACAACMCCLHVLPALSACAPCLCYQLVLSLPVLSVRAACIHAFCSALMGYALCIRGSDVCNLHSIICVCGHMCVA
jgi:hypothetical protein